MKRGASVLITTANDSVFLILRRGQPGFAHHWRRYAADPWFKRIGRSIYHAWNDGVWSLPGGLADPGESALDCAVRELKEETGLPCDSAGMRTELRKLNRFHMPLAFDWTVFHLPLSGVPPHWPDPHARDRLEYTDSGWFSMSALPRPAHVLLEPAVGRARGIIKRNRQNS